ncbi:hypothetical protein, partial [Limnovirga soli]
MAFVQLQITAIAQVAGSCSNTALQPVFSRDFGQSANSSSTTTAPAGSTGYKYGNVGTDGNYIVTPLVDNANKGDWTKGGDHTGNSHGNMFLVNAGSNKSVFFRDTVNNLCQGSVFNFSAWLANVNTSSTTAICGNNLVYGNVIFKIKNLAGVVLDSVITGNLPLSPVNGPPNWIQYGMQFALPVNTTSLILEMVDYYGGGNQCGNDLALDDILFTACTPQVTAAFTTPSSVCLGSSINIAASLVNNPFTQPAYQWQKSIDGGSNWTNIGTASTAATSYSINTTAYSDAALYRVMVGPSVASLTGNTCVTVSNSVQLSVNPYPSATISVSSPDCYGGNLSFTANITSGTLPFTYSWTGPNGFSSLLANPVILNVNGAASGTYNVNISDVNGCGVSASTSVTVSTLPVITPITGPDSVCVGHTINLSEATAGGSWLSDNSGIATISNTGLVTGISAG